MAHRGYDTIETSKPASAGVMVATKSTTLAGLAQTCSEPDPTQSTPDSEGGKRSLLALFGCFCAFFASLSMLNSIGVYQTFVSQHQLREVSSGKIGWIFGCHSFLSFFAGLFFGPLFDAWGPRPLASLGTCTLATTYLTLGICEAYWEFFLCIGVMGGITTSLLFTAAMGTVQHWFLRYRGLATGIAVSGGSVGGIVFPIILGVLIPKVGFAWTTRIIGFILTFMALLSIALMKGRFFKPISNWRVVAPDLSALKGLRNRILVLGMLFIELGIFVPMAFLASYGLTQGLSQRESYQLQTVMNVGSLIGRWLPGYIGDTIGRFNSFVLALAFCLISILGIWLPAGTNQSQMIAFAICFGLGSGSGISLAPACLAQLCDIEDYGRFFTTFFTVASFGSLLGIPLSGRILQASNGEFFGLIKFAGLVYAFAFTCVAAVRVMEVGWKMTIKF